MVRQDEIQRALPALAGAQDYHLHHPSQAAQIDGETLDMGTWHASVIPAAIASSSLMATRPSAARNPASTLPV